MADGYGVVFLHRAASRVPELHHAQTHVAEYSDAPAGAARAAHTAAAEAYLQRYAAAQERGVLCVVPFTTVQDYLFLLRAASAALAPARRDAMAVLAAAVSDFYVPRHAMAEHKIQSSGGAAGLHLHLTGVPKALAAVRTAWAPDALVVSFKLETDASLLTRKARAAIDAYGVHAVVANLLPHRYREITVVSTRPLPSSLQLAAPALSTFEVQRRAVEAGAVAAGAATASTVDGGTWRLAMVPAPKGGAPPTFAATFTVATPPAAVGPTNAAYSPLEDALAVALQALHAAHAGSAAHAAHAAPPPPAADH